MSRGARGIHWFRNDLRLRDNTALNDLAERCDAWLPVFVLDRRLTGPAPRTRFFLDALARLARDLEGRGIPLLVREGRPEDLLPKLVHETGAQVVSWNENATPFARMRDAEVRRALERSGVAVRSHRDDVIFGADDLRTGQGRHYAVYTPFRNAWWKRWRDAPRRAAPLARLPAPIPGFEGDPVPAASAVGAACDVAIPAAGEQAARRRLVAFLDGPVARYAEDRDLPGIDGTSRLSPHLRCGAISVRQCFDRALEASAEDPRLSRGVAKWLDELIWREFHASILEAHPRVLRSNHRPEYDALVWNDDAAGFEAWCEGRTGYPFVDAGMRQLRATGWMHNRVRMVVASFLTKDLLIDWREGERFFHDALVDGDPASNNGGWQWAASTGTDAQPYFRIFNPVAQGRRFDPDGRYVRRWIPELRDLSPGAVHSPWEAGLLFHDYPPPRVDHAERREEALARYREAREQGPGS